MACPILERTSSSVATFALMSSTEAVESLAITVLTSASAVSTSPLTLGGTLSADSARNFSVE
jgi:hypothetical protein